MPVATDLSTYVFFSAHFYVIYIPPAYWIRKYPPGNPFVVEPRDEPPIETFDNVGEYDGGAVLVDASAMSLGL